MRNENGSMEAVKGKLSSVVKKKHEDHDKKATRTSGIPPFHSRLTDVGLYSFGGLCAVSLMKLFGEECHLVFKKKTLEKILLDLGQPKQTNESMFAILDGEIMQDSDTFVDELLKEDVLKEARQPLVEDLITLAIQEGCYDARMRVLIKHVAWQLRVTWDQVEGIEQDMAEEIEYNAYVMTEEQAKEKTKKLRNRKIKRYALIGLATVGGGAIIGLTGGLAAPLVAAGAGAVIGGAGAAALGSAAGVAIIGSLFGVTGAGLTGYKMKKRVGAVEEFSFEALTLRGSKYDTARTVKQLQITIAVTGWLNDEFQDFRRPWSCLAESQEQYSLRWESKYLYQLGEAFDSIIQAGISVATTEALKYTILAGIITAIAWPAALISAAGAIDNPWHVCTQRATEAGKQLADVLLSREHGNRPVTLIGFSMGARVIFSCLEELCKRKGNEGLIEDVILLGAPVSGDVKHWTPLTKVVAGKIVNGYARGDWMLKFLYRAASVTFKVAGLGPVKWDNHRMHNIDLSDVIDGHMDYMKNIDIVLKAVGIRTKDELHTEMINSYTSKHSKDSSANTSPTTEKPTSKDSEEDSGISIAHMDKASDNMNPSTSKDSEENIGISLAHTDKALGNMKLTTEDTGDQSETSETAEDTHVTERTSAIDNYKGHEADLIKANQDRHEENDNLKNMSGKSKPDVPHSVHYETKSGKIDLETQQQEDQSCSENVKGEKDSSDTSSDSNKTVQGKAKGFVKQVKDGLARRKEGKRVRQKDKNVERANSLQWDRCDFTDSNPTSEDES